jgi:hypothetical protein
VLKHPRFRSQNYLVPFLAFFVSSAGEGAEAGVGASRVLSSLRLFSALTHEFLGKALEVWRLTSSGIGVDCIEMDCISQERALLEGRIAVGLLVPSDRPLLELLQVRLLPKYPVKLALRSLTPMQTSLRFLYRS